MTQNKATEKIAQFHPGLKTIVFLAGFAFVYIDGAKRKVYNYSGDSLSTLNR